MFDFKLAIIKADDFGRGPLIDNWRIFVDLCLECGFLPSIGVVGSDFSRNPRAQSLARYLGETLAVEFWNHSYHHRDLNQMSPAERVADIVRAQSIIEDAIGTRPRVFGAPYNMADADCVRDVVATGEFDSYFFLDALTQNPANIARKYLITPEVGTQYYRPVDFSFFKAILDRRSDPPAAVVQVHPAYWTASCFAEFRKVLETLRHKNYENLGARDMVSYQRARSEPPTGLRDSGAILGFVRRVYQVASSDEIFRRKMAPGDFEYYFDRLRHGLAASARFLRRNGVGVAASPAAPLTVVDIGGGIGNWALAALGVAAGVKAVSVDRNKLFAEFMSAQVRGHGDGRISFAVQDAAALQFGDASVDNIICVNAINYMPIRGVMDEMVRVIRDNRTIVVGLQNELYPILDGLRMLVRGNPELAIERFGRYLRNELRRQGLGTETFVSYWNDLELTAMAMLAGLQPLTRGGEMPLDYGSLFGEPVLVSYVFVKTAQSVKRAANLAAEPPGRAAALLQTDMAPFADQAEGSPESLAWSPTRSQAEEIESHFRSFAPTWPAELPERGCSVGPWFDAVYDFSRALQQANSTAAISALDRLFGLGRSQYEVRRLLAGPRVEPAEAAPSGREVERQAVSAEIARWRGRLLPAILASGARPSPQPAPEASLAVQ